MTRQECNVTHHHGTKTGGVTLRIMCLNATLTAETVVHLLVESAIQRSMNAASQTGNINLNWNNGK